MGSRRTSAASKRQKVTLPDDEEEEEEADDDAAAAARGSRDPSSSPVPEGESVVEAIESHGYDSDDELMYEVRWRGPEGPGKRTWEMASSMYAACCSWMLVPLPLTLSSEPTFGQSWMLTTS